MIFRNLFVEITRKCETGCEYCLRGNSENLDMSSDVMISIFRDVSEVTELMITGGEPLADPKLLSKLISIISDSGTKIGHFRIVTSLEKYDSEKSFAVLDKLHSITEEPALDYVEISRDADKKLVVSKKHKLIEDLTKSHEYLIANNDIHNHQRIGFSGCYIASGKAENFKDSFNSTYLNGFDVDKETETVKSDVYVSSNGNVVTSCDLSYKNIDNNLINFGNVLKSKLFNIVIANAKSEEELKEIELPTAGAISFSQYWESLSEAQRGDCFGYVLHLMYDRNLMGFGIFESIRHHGELSRLKILENFTTLLNLEESVEPPWFDDDDRKFVQNMKLELCGYLKIACSELFTLNPIMELIDLYYHDFPYCAGRRLNAFINKLCYHSNEKNSEK